MLLISHVLYEIPSVFKFQLEIWMFGSHTHTTDIISITFSSPQLNNLYQPIFDVIVCRHFSLNADITDRRHTVPQLPQQLP